MLEAIFDCVPHFKGHVQAIIPMTRLVAFDAARGSGTMGFQPDVLQVLSGSKA